MVQGLDVSIYFLCLLNIEEAINNVFLLSRVMYKAALGLHLTSQYEPEEEKA
jgi:hypothetical protein